MILQLNLVAISKDKYEEKLKGHFSYSEKCPFKMS